MPLMVTMFSWFGMALSILLTSYSLLMSAGGVREVAGNFTANFRPPSVPLVVVDPYLRSVFVSQHRFLNHHPSVEYYAYFHLLFQHEVLVGTDPCLCIYTATNVTHEYKQFMLS